jgi:fucose 4-O-acetylase-like acetyltransferase
LESGGRIAWIDCARGIGISLVVIGHVLRGLVAASILPRSNAVVLTDAWIYSFHMPLFFLLSGVFGPRNLDRPTGPFLDRELRAVAYPYFVWSFVQTIIQLALTPYTNHPAELRDLARIPWEPVMQFWFFYALFVILLFVHALRVLGLSYLQVLWVTVALGVASGFVWLGPWSVVHDAVHNAPYFALGAAAGPTILSIGGRLPPRRAALGTLLGFALLAALIVEGVGGSLAASALALIGIASSLALAVWLAEPTFSALRRLGVYSLPIYVAHTLASAGIRIALRSFLHVESASLHLVAGIAGGLLAPLWLAEFFERIGFRYAFSWPSAWYPQENR